MKDTVKAILNIFQNLGYKAYYSGESFRNEIYVEVSGKHHLKNVIPTVIVDCDPEEVLRVFQYVTQDETNPMVFTIEFGNEIISIECFHTQCYFINDLKTEDFLSKPIVERTHSLAEDFKRRCFTINCMAQDVEENNIFEYNSRIDMVNGVIQTISNSKELFLEYPIRTLQAFTLMSQTGFTIDKQVQKDIKSTMRYLRYIPSELVGKELRRIMHGKYVIQTFKLMQSIGIFNSKCLVNNEKVKILTPFHEAKEETFDILSKFKITKDAELEFWSLLFDNPETAINELSKFNVFSDKELNTIQWLMNNRDICHSNDNITTRKLIYNSIHDFERKEGIHYLKELIIKLNHTYKMLSDDDKKTKDERFKHLMFNLCCRPYFVNQLTWHITKEQKAELIPQLIEEKEYPFMEEDVNKYLETHLTD